MLDLHLVEQHVPVLRDLDVTGAAHLEEVKEVEGGGVRRGGGGTHQHLHSALGTKVGLQDVLDAPGARHVDGERLGKK